MPQMQGMRFGDRGSLEPFPQDLSVMIITSLDNLDILPSERCYSSAGRYCRRSIESGIYVLLAYKV